MLPEYRELITALKGKDAHFDKLFNEHNKLDHDVAAAEEGRVHMSDLEIRGLKREKLRLKDELYAYLNEVAAKEEAK